MQFNTCVRSCLAGTVLITLLSGCDLPEAPISLNVEKPDIIIFDASVSEMQDALKSVCDTLEIRSIEPNPNIPQIKSQTQIDCQGFGYFGQKRQAEFVFFNDKLSLTWILVGADEIPALETAFTETYGSATTTKDTIMLFAYNNAAVRNDTPEALYYSDAITTYVVDRINKLPDREQ